MKYNNKEEMEKVLHNIAQDLAELLSDVCEMENKMAGRLRIEVLNVGGMGTIKIDIKTTDDVEIIPVSKEGIPNDNAQDPTPGAAEEQTEPTGIQDGEPVTTEDIDTLLAHILRKDEE